MAVIKLMYVCDYNKNTECAKRGCQQRCKHTKDLQYALYPYRGVFIQSLGSVRDDTHHEQYERPES